MELNYRKFGEPGRGEHALVIFHGLFGSSDNWQSVARRLENQFELFLVDMRNHGKSPQSDDFTYNIMAQDILDFLQQHKLEKVVLIGHSMGGKAVMRFAQLHSAYVHKLVVIDIGPQAYPPHHQHIFEALESVNFEALNTRKAVETHIATKISDFATRQFLMKNLYWKEKGQLGWRFNLPVLSKTIEHITGKIPADVVEVDTLFIRGALSNYILDENEEQIEEQFPFSSIETVEGAGHWVHAEKPDELMELLYYFAR